MNKDLIIAHRGVYNNIDIPENTISSFRKAINNNYYIELDIGMTKDNILIVYHDKNLNRMTNINKNVKNMNYNDIKNIYLLNTKEKIPTLEEVIKLNNNKVFLIIEIKKDKRYKKIVDNLMKLLNTYSVTYLIQSFDIKTLYYINKHYSNTLKGILLSKKSRRKNCYLPLLSILKITNVNFISISKSLINDKNSKYINKYPTYIWTIKSKKELNKYINKFTGYICDNLPYK